MCTSCIKTKNDTPKKDIFINKSVLFIGNSYTNGVQKVFREIIKETPYKDYKFRFIWGGGATLNKLINNGRALKWIKKEKWDVVVLQEQSLTPALEGERQESFYESVELLTKEIRKVDAEPLLFLTWGRRDGYQPKKKLLPNFETMQGKLSVAYDEAAKRNGLRIIRIGEAWSMVIKKDKTLGRRLFANDGSHPSSNGAFLSACVILKTLFNDPLVSIPTPAALDAKECEKLLETVKGMKKAK